MNIPGQLASSRRSAFRVKLEEGFPLLCQIRTETVSFGVRVLNISHTGILTVPPQGVPRFLPGITVGVSIQLLTPHENFQACCRGEIVHAGEGKLGIHFSDPFNSSRRNPPKDYLALFAAIQQEQLRRKTL
ncbi:MAG: PilZ domain-containing protein [Planctomycetaceae bacterium]|nr:PilZ domain-containing protein [Planctomycetaceae bacterium]